MNRAQLVSAVATRTGLSRTEAERVVQSLLAAIAAALAAGQTVRISGFGSFQVTARAAATGRNPRTGATLHLPPSRRLRFRAAKALRSAGLAGDPTTKP